MPSGPKRPPLAERAQVQAAEIASQCLAVRARLVDRVITSVFDRAVRPYGLKPSQLNVLVAITLSGETGPEPISTVLRMSPSTVSRHLERLQRRGLIDVTVGEDARTRLVRPSAAGAALILEIGPAWRSAQEAVATIIGDEGVAGLDLLASRVSAGSLNSV